MVIVMTEITTPLALRALNKSMGSNCVRLVAIFVNSTMSSLGTLCGVKQYENESAHSTYDCWL